MSFSQLSVFVYGTLKPGGCYWARFCEGKVQRTTPARIRGELYDLGCGYPGAVFNECGWIEGCVHEFIWPVDFAAVDALEGYCINGAPDKNEYERRIVTCFDYQELELGRVWAYEVNPQMLLASKAQRLPDGCWLV
ncbi:MAG: Uncharacterised protein [Opitutia bacterium UBA7350]|nr:MAG: Uncharacterised protein [Opitutae bacterium UBA7350]